MSSATEPGLGAGRAVAPLLLALAVAFGGALPGTLRAGAPGLELELAVERLEAAELAASDLRLTLQPTATGAGLGLRLERLRLAPGLELRDLALDCEELEWAGERLVCARAALRLRHPLLGALAAEGRLDYHPLSGAFALELHAAAFAGGRLDLRVEGDVRDARVTLRGEGLEAATLHGWLVALAPSLNRHQALGGRLDLDLVLRRQGAALDIERLRVRTRELGFSGPELAEGAALALDARGGWAGGVLTLSGAASLEAGAVYFEPGPRVGDSALGVTLEASEAGAPELDFRLRYRPRGSRLELTGLEFRHPGALVARAEAVLALGAGRKLEALRLEVEDLRLPAFHRAYLLPLCAQIEVFCGLEVEGGLSGRLELDASGWREAELVLDDVYLDERGRRFRAAGLEGRLAVVRGETVRRSRLGWQALGVYRLDFGAAEVEFASSRGELQVARGQPLPFLDGSLSLRELRLSGLDSGAFTLVTEAELSPVAMADFCQAMGWPPMAGSLAGVFPRMVYQDGRLVLHGDLLVRVFDGEVRVRGLRAERLFGRAPVLETDIEVEAIDLRQLTDTFAFGSIEGRLQGRIEGLRLMNWSPVAFDARLETPPEDASRHRISRRAVDNLSAIGSGGVGGALQGGLLSLFDEYSYGRLGLACRLEQGLCTLDGVEPAPEGFYIVTRGGLLPPWVEVKGTGRQVPWASLLYGIRRMAEGGAEVQ